MKNSLILIPIALLFAVLIYVLSPLGHNLPTISSANINHEPDEWLHVTIPDTNDKDLKRPRILLIGDSIAISYYERIIRQLGDKASIAILATSLPIGNPELLAEVKLVLHQYHFSIIQFNNGLHGFENNEEIYKKNFSLLLQTIKKNAPDAKLIWATTTPMWKPEDLHSLHSFNERIKQRNQIALDIVSGEHIPVNDLYAATIDHPEDFASDGIHLNQFGITAATDQTVQALSAQLP